jgi:hypothetical protein
MGGSKDTPTAHTFQFNIMCLLVLIFVLYLFSNFLVLFFFLV